MKKLFLFEIEADEKPIYNIGEWEDEATLTSNIEIAKNRLVVAYGEIEGETYIELYDKEE